MLLKFAVLMSHLLIVGVGVAMGKYAVKIDWSEEKKELHSHFQKVMAM